MEHTYKQKQIKHNRGKERNTCTSALYLDTAFLGLLQKLGRRVVLMLGPALKSFKQFATALK